MKFAKIAHVGIGGVVRESRDGASADNSRLEKLGWYWGFVRYARAVDGMVCSFGALKLGGLCCVNTGLAYYHAIGTYLAQPILGCISRLGRFA